MAVTYPDADWDRADPADVGIEPDAWSAWLARQSPTGASVGGESHPGREWGTVLVHGGRLVHTWGDPDYRYNSASVAKSFTRLALQVAIDLGLIESADDPIARYWTGEGPLNHPDKHLDRGHHVALTFRHCLTMTGGFPVSNGHTWRRGEHPDWADPHDGDPDRANYAHRRPGIAAHYSSGGFWRCTQALTCILDRELKDVLDEALFSSIGIRSEAWDLLPGRQVRENEHFYPDWPGYGGFIDPPYEIGGHRVQGGGGWAVMSASDLARVGLLLASGGMWRGERLVEPTEFVTQGQRGDIRGWNGGNSSTLSAWPGSKTVIAAVTTVGLDWQTVPFARA